MAQELSDYLLGERGVQITSSPIHTPDGGLLDAQNVEFVRDQGLGGLGSRAGTAPLNTTALAGPVMAVSNMPLSFPEGLRTPPAGLYMLVGLNNGETNTWDRTRNGTTYAGLPTSTLLRPAGVDKWATVTRPIGCARAASPQAQALYYAGNDYVQGTDAPPFLVFRQNQDFTQFRVPMNPAITTPSLLITDVLTYNGVIYLAVLDALDGGGSHRGRVLAFDPSNGTLKQIGNRFGPDAGEVLFGYPACLAFYLGRLWVGLVSISISGQGPWSIDPTLPNDVWAVNNHVVAIPITAMCAYRGTLYIGTDALSGPTNYVFARTSTGTLPTAFTSTGTPTVIPYFYGAIVFNDALYIAWYGGATGDCLIHKFDGTTWTTDLDVGTTYASLAPCQPVVFNGHLYWGFNDDTTATGTSNFLLQRTVGGVWSQVLSGVGVRGTLGFVNMES